MDSNPKHLFKIFLISMIALAIVVGLIYKANNPSDYRHPRDRAIQLH
ncbi:MAG: hypothetical protein QM497_07970 [Sulfurimonas sp.]